jgi:hypothetical protein
MKYSFSAQLSTGFVEHKYTIESRADARALIKTILHDGHTLNAAELLLISGLRKNIRTKGKFQPVTIINRNPNR